MVTIDDLPFEIKLIIFELLDIKDLVGCRLVQKAWKEIVSHVKIEELVFNDRDNLNCKWYYINQAARNVIKIKSECKLNLLKSMAFNLRSLKYLMIRASIDLNEDYEFQKIEYLNRYLKLEQLEIHKYDGNDDKLVLPNLRCICLNSIYFGNLFIEAKKLTTILCRIGIDKIDLKYYDTIKRLEIYSFKEKVFEFLNLESLIVDYTDSPIKNILHHLPKLHIIKLNLTEYDETFYENTIETIRNLLNEKRKLNKTIKIYFKDHLIVDEEQISHFQSNPELLFEDLNDTETDSDTESDLEKYVYHDDDYSYGYGSDDYDSDLAGYDY